MTTSDAILAELIQTLTRTLVQTRDFCGDEPEAARDFLTENGINPDSPEGLSMTATATNLARIFWNRSRRAAIRAAKVL